LQTWSRKINLIGPGSDLEIIENHFLDSLTLLKVLPEGCGGPLLDVGSGAGFPGLVVKVARPEMALTIMEPRQKRVAFLRHITRQMGVDRGVEILGLRLRGDEEDKQAVSELFPLITCRGLKRLDIFLNMARPLLAPGGRIICLKGPRADEEIALWRSQKGREIELLESPELTLPFSGARRRLVVFGTL